jgi:hypothetical protein
MAGVLADINSGEIALVANTPKTVLQIVAAANHRVKLLGFAIYVKGIFSAATDNLKFRILRQSTAGTMSAGVAGTNLSKTNESDDETLQTSVQIDASAPPTSGDVVEFGEVQQGMRVFFPFGQEKPIKGGTRLGFELTATLAATASVYALIEE